MSGKEKRVFDTEKRVKLGIWGLGRGQVFYKCCKLLNVDVVAGCDFNPALRESFKKANPDAFVTDDVEEFFKRDFDAVALATYCPAHGEHALKCLRAGKHVLSEVTAFYTMAEGVRLVEEVEKRKLVYNLAENYPFSAGGMWLAKRWKEGLFGELMHGEFDYVHECRKLAYSFPDGAPVTPGSQLHTWRSWFNFHHYCTHSLGPAMFITGTRPVRVESFESSPTLAGYPVQFAGMGMTPSLIRMSNGGTVRNLMGASTNDNHWGMRVWGTRGSVECGHDGMRLRLGASGGSPLFKVEPRWEEFGELAELTGHGGGDFWVLHNFIREILFGIKSPFDIYSSADVTIPGILACRSSHEGGRPFDVPDFRKKSERDKYRDDNWTQERIDPKTHAFGAGAKIDAKAGRFTALVNSLIDVATLWRAFHDWRKVLPWMSNPEELRGAANALFAKLPQLRSVYKEARELVDAHPGSEAARILSELLALGDEEQALNGKTPSPATIEKEIALAKKAVAAREKERKAAWRKELAKKHVKKVEGAALPGLKTFEKRALSGKGLKFVELPPLFNAASKMFDIRPLSQRSGAELVRVRCLVSSKKAVDGELRAGADAPFKLFLNGKEIACDMTASNPISGSCATSKVEWRKGANKIELLMRTNGGAAWGFLLDPRLD